MKRALNLISIPVPSTNKHLKVRLAVLIFVKLVTTIREERCVVNKPLLKTLALAQLGLAAALTLFSTIIDPPTPVNILIASAVAGIEGLSVGIVMRYLRRGCLR